ncbi:hypothetical protein [Mycobacteroides abscessus]|uniref:hypothetical protein n=1 Tax=Mycobacteroides abscessus TaxID=36809 RepID=UPI0009A6E9C6|nr:hypothetical protein [Mycobacteroides abscessus]MDO3333966.1 acetyl-CoA acetyltransferase [Mycobacteroides abscessus subsp. bolletii]QSM91738.1 acetyl-CoA acetyltransferase [Mycobacteroides abscessus subsp. bolletii]
MSVNPRTPVLVGVGEYSERIDDDRYRALSPVELGATAARLALEDTGIDSHLLARRIDTVVGIRQFDFGGGFTPPAQGRSDNPPRSVADRIGADPARAILPTIGGHTPQKMLTETAALIAAGDAEIVLLVGAEATSTMRYFQGRDGAPDFSEERGSQLDDRGLGLDGLPLELMVDNDLTDAPTQFGLFENARRRRLGLTRGEYAQQMGELFAPFSRVAATNPHAVAPVELDADELIAPSARNRLVADPYPRLLVARNMVNQAAAVVMMSLGTARNLGVAADRWVFLHGHADFVDPAPFDRLDLSRSPASEAAVSGAIRMAGIGVDDLAHLDLYSCFPFAVFAVADYLGIGFDDPRGLTVTGGLPFFGGPGNDYALHAIVKICERLRCAPGAFGLVSAAGGAFHKHSAGVYSAEPAPWRQHSDTRLIQDGIDNAPRARTVRRAQGWMTVQTCTVQYKANGLNGVVVGQLEETGERLIATTTDPETLELLERGEPFDHRVHSHAAADGNRISLQSGKFKLSGGSCAFT